MRLSARPEAHLETEEEDASDTHSHEPKKVFDIHAHHSRELGCAASGENRGRQASQSTFSSALSGRAKQAQDYQRPNGQDQAEETDTVLRAGAWIMVDAGSRSGQPHVDLSQVQGPTVALHGRRS